MRYSITTLTTETMKENSCDMDSRMTLFDLTAQMAEIEDALYESGGELTPELEKEMTETRESLLSKVDSYNALYQHLGATAAAAKAEADRLKKIQRTAENAQKRIREHLLGCMKAFGLHKLEGRLCKMGIRKSTALEVDEGLILKPYAERIAAINASLPPYIRVSAEISKTAIRDMYRGTNALPAGCAEVQNESLQIR